MTLETPLFARKAVLDCYARAISRAAAEHVQTYHTSIRYAPWYTVLTLWRHGSCAAEAQQDRGAWGQAYVGRMAAPMWSDGASVEALTVTFVQFHGCFCPHPQLCKFRLALTLTSVRKMIRAFGHHTILSDSVFRYRIKPYRAQILAARANLTPTLAR